MFVYKKHILYMVVRIQLLKFRVISGSISSFRIFICTYSYSTSLYIRSFICLYLFFTISFDLLSVIYPQHFLSLLYLSHKLDISVKLAYFSDSLKFMLLKLSGFLIFYSYLFSILGHMFITI